MSRPDTHLPDFEYPSFDGRDFQFGASAHTSAGMRKFPFNTREPPRDSPRDYPYTRDNAISGFYPIPSTTMHTSIAGGGGIDGIRGAGNGNGNNGYPSGMVSPPRMYNAPNTAGQTMGALSSMDNWSSASPTAAPNMNRPNSGPSASVAAVATSGSQVQPSTGQQHLVLNHHHRASPPRPPLAYPSPSPATAAAFTDRDVLRDAYYNRHIQQQHSTSPPNAPPPLAQPASLPSPTSTSSPRSTLWWGELEPWMDEEYAKQVCNIMGWDPVNIKVPRPAPDPVTGRQANNPGYCFLTFPSQSHAASVLAQINNSNGNVAMPNSSRPFNLNWASSVPTAPLSAAFTGPTISIPGAQNPQYPKEYSIFVGDLAPEVSNSDLVAVFRNPVLGLRNDREPRFIRPFLSCKSAKIMLDPVTGVSRGYGFVRFTDEADQQRALIEMHGLYCLSRPMRISPATAKFKPPPGMTGLEYQMQFTGLMPNVPAVPEQPVTVALPLPSTNQTKSVSTPLATSTANTSASTSGTSISSAAGSAPSLSSNSSSASSATLATAPSDEVLISTGQSAIPATTPSVTSPANNSVPNSISTGLAAQQTQDQLMAQRFNIPEESWKHHAQARAILSNLIGPNGEQLTSSDPYNTTVFVGGLSPLISEETLRTFFVPFGDIHYVKVPVGKHCGFVQFVRKPDAERAIEKMQGFPIGGSRIRLSWGRSQYKAAQAAAQAAQATALQAQYQVQVPSQPTSSITPEQAMQLLEKFGIAQFLTSNGLTPESNLNSQPALPTAATNSDPTADILSQYEGFSPSVFEHRGSGQFSSTSFSPFSPDPNYLADSLKSSNISATTQNSQSFGISPKGYAPWYTATHPEEKPSNGSGKVSPASLQSARPPSAQRFGSFLAGENNASSINQCSRSSSRQEALIARPELSRRPSQVLPVQETYPTPQAPEHEHIQDVNGTLASLNLDHIQRSWKADNEAARALVSSP